MPPKGKGGKGAKGKLQIWCWTNKTQQTSFYSTFEHKCCCTIYWHAS